MHPLPYIIYHILPALSNTTASAPGVKGFKGSRIPGFQVKALILWLKSRLRFALEPCVAMRHIPYSLIYAKRSGIYSLPAQTVS